MADKIILRLTMKQAALVSMCISHTIILASGKASFSVPLSELVFDNMTDLRSIMDEMVSQLDKFPDASDVEGWLKS